MCRSDLAGLVCETLVVMPGDGQQDEPAQEAPEIELQSVWVGLAAVEINRVVNAFPSASPLRQAP
jgi:hypothetical protein